MWEANPEMFHKAEEFLSKTTDSEVDEMDTSDTQWGWFYLAECGKWHMFQPDTNIQCSVSSEDIEKSFKTNPCGSISFTTSKFSYKIDFAEMKQMNLTTGKQRLIKRAPFSISAFSYICENEAIPMPPHWENVNTDVPYQLIPLHNQTHEYNEVASLFGKTMDRNRIKRIQRIQNLDLWEFFCRKKAQLKKKSGVPQINEQMLFHGTSSEFVEAICIHNFDWRINGIHGALFGKARLGIIPFKEEPSSPGFPLVAWKSKLNSFCDSVYDFDQKTKPTLASPACKMGFALYEGPRIYVVSRDKV
ncbi:protein mono-ADP-ribosyltransferase PARP11 isoform X3 [Phyllostomus discolor]|uniref:Poly [ADP-ribose] polymerase n=1 Tax=Phyllostomus discolor TaxID=89673 RepID=A0A7E6D5E0_9CHIR|nr:protein mono-ADP-ribosyltransferase PARP11 isoform X3 [Phyllostomus discolor]